MTPVEQIQSQLLSLQEALLKQMPQMPSMLQQIHKQLKANPDVVTLLTEDEINILFKGLEKQVGVTLASDAVKKASNSTSLKAKIKTMNLNDDL